MAKPRIIATASASSFGERRPDTRRTLVRGRRRKQRQRDADDGSVVDSTLGIDAPVVGNLEFAANETVRELARFDGERADVARNGRTIIVRRIAEYDFESTLAGAARRAENENDDMGRQSRGEWTGDNLGKVGTRDVDARRRSLDLSEGEVVDEQRCDDLHGASLLLVPLYS